MPGDCTLFIQVSFCVPMIVFFLGHEFNDVITSSHARSLLALPTFVFSFSILCWDCGYWSRGTERTRKKPLMWLHFRKVFGQMKCSHLWQWTQIFPDTEMSISEQSTNTKYTELVRGKEKAGVPDLYNLACTHSLMQHKAQALRYSGQHGSSTWEVAW